MAERTKGLHWIVTVPALYTRIQSGLAGPQAKERIAHELFSGLENKRVVEIGCGPGLWSTNLQHAGSYVGVDRNERHIAAANSRFGTPHTTFLCGDLADAGVIAAIGACDAVVAIGILHHLDDAVAKSVLAQSAALLRPNGVFIGLEPVYHDHQNPVARLLKWLDSGKDIRREEGYRSLFPKHLALETQVKTNLMRVPYSHILIRGIMP
ncbi:MAG: class I SAM-dependent methyltransferase [Fuscovulum sp.]|nr:MAG: class I SAM-dependent methyltransferase [Fuscovulum sp.]